MLEELQRLKAHIDALKSRLTECESENNTLKDTQFLSNQQFNAQTELKNSIIEQKQEENSQLLQQLQTSQAQLKQLNDDATTLADRYNRLEKVVLI